VKALLRLFSADVATHLKRQSGSVRRGKALSRLFEGSIKALLKLYSAGVATHLKEALRRAAAAR
jgi:hypothetical protein